MQSGNIVSGEALHGKDKVQLADALKDVPVVAYYFSAHWCPPCRGFTPALVDCYKEWNKDKKEIEVIFMTRDKDDNQFKSYYADMPWLALPHNDQRILKIKEKFGVNSIPRLVIVGKNEEILTDKGVQDVMQEEEKALAKWKGLYK